MYVLVEKDPGEKRWADFAAFYLRWQGRVWPLEIVVGDVRPGWGQGVVFGRAAARRGTPFPAFRRDSEKIDYRSSGENGAVRGLAFYYRGRRFVTVLVAGRAQLDARVDEMGKVTSLPESGVHVTVGEVAGRKQLQSRVGAWRGRYLGEHLQVGASVQEVRFEREVDLRRTGKTPWAFHGRRQGLMAVDARYDGGTWRQVLEVGANERGKWGGVGVLRLELGRLRIASVVRHYDAGFHSFYGGASSATGMENEEGYLLLLEQSRGRQKWRLYVDQYKRLQPTFSLPTPSISEVWGAGVEGRVGKRGRWQALYQDRRTPGWKAEILQIKRSRRARVEGRYGDRERQVALRLEGRYVDGGGEAARGGMGSVRFKGGWRKSHYVFHLSRFSTDSYAARIYEFEYDLPGAVSIRPLFGRGWRFYALIGGQWRVLQFSGRYRYQQGRPAPHYWGAQVDVQIGR